MLALYDNFPANFHEREYFLASLSLGKTQQAFAQATHKLNREPLNTEKKSIPSISDYVVTLEMGIAEGNDFIQIDKDEETRIIKTANSTPFQIMDFLCTATYHMIKDGKSKPFRFDYFMLRFIFDQKLIEARAFHERGPRRITPKEIIDIIIDKINANSAKKILKPFKPES
jgi:hypothetical protein